MGPGAMDCVREELTHELTASNLTGRLMSFTRNKKRGGKFNTSQDYSSSSALGIQIYKFASRCCWLMRKWGKETLSLNNLIVGSFQERTPCLSPQHLLLLLLLLPLLLPLLLLLLPLLLPLLLLLLLLLLPLLLPLLLLLLLLLRLRQRRCAPIKSLWMNASAEILSGWLGRVLSVLATAEEKKKIIVLKIH